tara:strand:- start:7786 stop:8544 length:759 start_codon:yes stop_codon:yes gene_type:complete
LLGIFSIYSQDIDSKLLKGRVVNDSLSLAAIHIVNKTKGNATITDQNGFFEIFTSINDTLLLSGVQFEPKMIIINSNILDSKEIIIPLEIFVNYLSEVIVKPNNLSGNLFRDFINSGLEETANFDDFGIPGYKGVRKEKIISKKSLIVSTLLLPISGGIDIEAVYKHLSGYYRDLKLKRKMDKDFNLISRIITFYGIDYFINTFNLSEDQIYDYVSGTYANYPLKKDFQQNNHAKVMQYFEENNLRIIKSLE